MGKFHVSQDETGYFQLTYEDEQGQLTLVSYQFDAPTQLIEDAVEMAESGEFPGAVVVVDPVRRTARESVDVDHAAGHALSRSAVDDAPAAAGRPRPRKAVQ
jgi:hypothetical protein